MFKKFVQTFTNFSQNTIINLIYNKVDLNIFKLSQTEIRFIKCFENFLNNILIFKQISSFNYLSKHSYICDFFKIFYIFTQKFENFLNILKFS